MIKKTVFFFIVNNKKNNTSWYKNHIINTLRHNYNLIYFNPFEENSLKKNEYNSLKKNAYNNKLIKKIKKIKKINLFFSMTNDTFLLPETIKEIKKLGIPTVNFSCDNIERPFDLRKIAPEFDYCWIPEREAMDTFRSYGANPIHLPMAANPDIYKPFNDEKEVEEAIFVGFKNSSRPKYIYDILEKTNLNLKVWGYGWKTINQNDTAKKRALSNPSNTIKYILNNLKYKEGRLGIYCDILNIFKEPKPSEKVLSKIDNHIGGELSFDDMIKLYSKSKVSLGFNERGNTYHLKKPLYQIRLRDFEAPMSGACYLMYRIPEMLEYFEEDKEMIFYDSFEELVDKIKFYTDPKNDKLRENIKINARKRAEKDHTWENRFEELFKIIGI